MIAVFVANHVLTIKATHVSAALACWRCAFPMLYIGGENWGYCTACALPVEAPLSLIFISGPMRGPNWFILGHFLSWPQGHNTNETLISVGGAGHVRRFH